MFSHKIKQVPLATKKPRYHCLYPRQRLVNLVKIKSNDTETFLTYGWVHQRVYDFILDLFKDKEKALDRFLDVVRNKNDGMSLLYSCCWKLYHLT